MVMVIKATEAHCKELAPKLRAMDVKEISATNPTLTPEEVLIKSVKVSVAHAVVDDDGCLAIFGVRDCGGKVGIPWMLASDRFFLKHSKRFVRECRAIVTGWVETFDYLFNFIMVGNKVCLRWLQWVGFTVHTKTEVLVNETLFYKFDLGKPNV